MKKLLLFLLFLNLVVANNNSFLPFGEYTGKITQTIKFVHSYYWGGDINAKVDSNGYFSIIIPQHDVSDKIKLNSTIIGFSSFTIDNSIPGACYPVRPTSSDSNVSDLLIDDCFYNNGNLKLHYIEMYESLFAVEGIIELNHN